MSSKHTSSKFFAIGLIALLFLGSLSALPAAAAPSIASLSAPVPVGGSFNVRGSGFTSGSMINFFVSTSKGAVNEGPLKPSAAAATLLTVDAPAAIPLGQGVVAVQVVNTDQGYAGSNVSYALLQGSASAGIPSLTGINGAGLAATSTAPSFAVDNVETVVAQGGEVTLQGTGFDTVDGVAVDLFCACAGGKVGPFFIKPGDPALSATSITVMLPAMGPDAPPVGPASFVVSNKGSDGKYSKKSNAVSVPIGSKISVMGVTQHGSTLTVDGTGFSTLTVINFYATRTGEVVNLGGLTAAGKSSIAVTLVSDTELTFNVPAGATPGPAYVQALNPPFIPFSSSGNDPNGSFILVDTAATPTPIVGATPTPIGAPSATPTAVPTFGVPTPTASSTGRPTATPTATPAIVAGVLFAGGSDNTVDASGSHPTLASAEVYDEETGAFSPTGPMAYPRTGHSVTMLNNGKMLIAGGHNAFSKRPMPSAELYDVKTGSFSFTGSMNSARLGHAAIVLKNGMVLVSGGMNVNFSVIDLAELYDPNTGQFNPTDSLTEARMGHTVTMLKDGSILVAGGGNDSGLLASAELYDTAADTTIATGSLSVPRQYASATLLNNGKVLIAGGATNTAACTGCATDTAELYDPATATFTRTASMHSRRRGHSATLLPDGRVLIAGGVDDNTATVLDSAEIYNPVTATFTPAASMHLARFDHAAMTLYDGKVLFAGGYDGPANITGAAELYDPSKGTFTPTGAMMDSRAGYGAACFKSAGAGSRTPSRGR